MKSFIGLAIALTTSAAFSHEITILNKYSHAKNVAVHLAKDPADKSQNRDMQVNLICDTIDASKEAGIAVSGGNAYSEKMLNRIGCTIYRNGESVTTSRAETHLFVFGSRFNFLIIRVTRKDGSNGYIVSEA